MLQAALLCGLGPDGEEAVLAVEGMLVPEAHALQLFASGSEAGGFASLVLRLARDSDGGLTPATTEGLEPGGRRRPSD